MVTVLNTVATVSETAYFQSQPETIRWTGEFWPSVAFVVLSPSLIKVKTKDEAAVLMCGYSSFLYIKSVLRAGLAIPRKPKLPK